MPPAPVAPTNTASPRRLRTIADVDRADPTELAMMKRAQVAALSTAARERRRERLNAATDVEWDISQIAAYFAVGVEAARKWRWRERTGQTGGRKMVLPKPIPGRLRKQAGRGAPSPLWRLPDILRLAVQKLRADRLDMITYRYDPMPDEPPTGPSVPSQRTPST